MYFKVPEEETEDNCERISGIGFKVGLDECEGFSFLAVNKATIIDVLCNV